jgi:hypothetical protein
MKKTLASLLILLNAGLAVWLVSRPPVAGIPPAEKAVGDRVSVAARPQLPAPSPPPAAGPFPVSLPSPIQPGFHWSQIESPDYRTYMDNLRRIGCPEATIRDLITADVQALYRTKRRGALQSLAAPYWQAGFGQAATNHAELVRLYSEERAVLTTLLGIVTDVSPATDSVPGTVNELKFCDALEPKRAAIQERWHRFELAKLGVLAGADGREATAEEIAELHALEVEQEAALNRLLTPSERIEFDVRNSPSARYLRQSLLGVEVNETEFRALFQTRKEFDGRLAAAATGEDALAAHHDFQTAAAQLLGPDRFARFERSQNPEFQEFFRYGAANDLDAITIETTWTEAQRFLAPADISGEVLKPSQVDAN